MLIFRWYCFSCSFMGNETVPHCSSLTPSKLSGTKSRQLSKKWTLSSSANKVNSIYWNVCWTSIYEYQIQRKFLLIVKLPVNGKIFYIYYQSQSLSKTLTHRFIKLSVVEEMDWTSNRQWVFALRNNTPFKL